MIWKDLQRTFNWGITFFVSFTFCISFPPTVWESVIMVVLFYALSVQRGLLR